MLLEQLSQIQTEKQMREAEKIPYVPGRASMRSRISYKELKDSEPLIKTGGRCPHDGRQGIQIRRYRQYNGMWVRQYRCPDGHIFEEIQ
jgi:hypothetical protein